MTGQGRWHLENGWALDGLVPEVFATASLDGTLALRAGSVGLPGAEGGEPVLEVPAGTVAHCELRFERAADDAGMTLRSARVRLADAAGATERAVRLTRPVAALGRHGGLLGEVLDTIGDWLVEVRLGGLSVDERGRVSVAGQLGGPFLPTMPLADVLRLPMLETSFAAWWRRAQRRSRGAELPWVPRLLPLAASGRFTLRAATDPVTLRLNGGGFEIGAGPGPVSLSVAGTLATAEDGRLTATVTPGVVLESPVGRLHLGREEAPARISWRPGERVRLELPFRWQNAALDGLIYRDG